jgi:hypothetical protein
VRRRIEPPVLLSVLPFSPAPPCPDAPAR